ncbi:hypothetical protein JOD57_000806 [Geodermatophilus bullaregiensis]|nr:hypothetical protein [Geodermatophilus bullaregiensis]MBM7804969.1 hypothetical protein [Geodermatophilus bullaregiensis]
MSSQRLLAFPVAGVGALALLFLMLTAQQPQRQASTQQDEPDAASAA